MIAVIQQPNYFPWLGYFEQCARAQVFVVLDSVQWIKQGRHHRTRIAPHLSQTSKTFQWLTIPIQSGDHRLKSLRDIKIDSSQNWARRHWKTLQSVYGRAPQFKDQFEPLLRPWFENAQSLNFLVDASWGSVELCSKALGIQPIVTQSSSLPEHGTKTQRLVSICQKIEATIYYSALGSTRYFDQALFRASGIEVLWQHWRHPVYAQSSTCFKSHLSILDALAFVSIPTIQSWLEPSPWGPFAHPTPL